MQHEDISHYLCVFFLYHNVQENNWEVVASIK